MKNIILLFLSDVKVHLEGDKVAVIRGRAGAHFAHLRLRIEYRPHATHSSTSVEFAVSE